jgi:phosphopantothenoylcysteine synthetase/decarboxylase
MLPRMQVLLAITGGIAAYKAPELVRRLRDAGCSVRCALSPSATRLVAPGALAAVSAQAVHTGLWTEDGSMPHIDLPRWCELMLVAPATADCLAKLALGLADDLPSTAALALDPGKPLVLAPAMNTTMWQHPAVQTNLATLRARGARVVDPVAGKLACNEEGIGAMADIPAIVAAVTAG